MAISNINNPDVVNINPSGVIRATGGTITQITESGINYTVHTFTSSGAFNVYAGGGDVEYLVVGGGGGSGRGNGSQGANGGGGGGGVTTGSIPLTVGSYPVVVGAGGTGFTGSNGRGNTGAQSSFAGII